MDDKVIETVNKYKIYIRPFISYPTFISLQKPFIKDQKYKLKEEKFDIKEVDASAMFDSKEILIRHLIIKIENSKGEAVDTRKDYLPLPPADYQQVMEIIDRLSEEAAEVYGKKKETK